MVLERSRKGVLGRHSVRARIALTCVGMFLVIAAASLAAIYTLVDHSLGPSPAQVPASVLRACQAMKADHVIKSVVLARCPIGPNDRARYLHILLVWSLAVLAIATLVTGVLWSAVGRRVLRPIHRVTLAARRASQEHLNERIALDGPDDELKELAETFDEMLDHLELAFASQRRFVANASHELRTPLTSMRTLIDVAMAKPERTTEGLEVLVRRLREALCQSEAIIDGLLTLARSDRGLTNRELLDFEAAAQDAIDQSGGAARAKNVTIEADLSAAPALGDRVLIERLVANLVDNAVRYNVTGGSVHVITGVDGDVSYVSVANTGPFVPEAKLASLFEPFTRLDERVTDGQGVGLGLSIVASVVSAHGGHLEAGALPDGGLKVTVRLSRGSESPDSHVRAPQHLLPTSS